MKEIFELIYEGVKTGDLETVREQVQNAINSDVSPEAILKEALIPPMEEVGQLFEEGEFFVPEMLIAARAMQAGLELIKPLLIDANVEPEGIVVIGTVKGDLHDIGKNLVGMMLEGAGFEIIDLGTDVSPEDFVNKVMDTINLNSSNTTVKIYDPVISKLGWVIISMLVVSICIFVLTGNLENPEFISNYAGKSCI